MPTLQYVGARYVPKLFDDGQGGISWQSDTYYEPLTIVSYRNSVYTSRKPVPASIGEPPVHSEYWALTGIDNGEIQEIKRQINAVQEDVNNINTEISGVKSDLAETGGEVATISADLTSVRNDLTATQASMKQISGINSFSDSYFLFIGDSYATGGVGDGGTPTTGWAAPLAEYIRSMGGKVYYSINGGEAFFNGKYLEQLNNAPKKPYTHILILGGFNDFDMNASDVTVSQFASRARTLYPKAQVMVGNVAIGNRGYYRKVMASRKAMHRHVVNNGMTWINNAHLWMHRASYVQPDGVHPTQAGINDLVYYAKEYLKSGYCDIIYSDGLTHIINNTAYYIKAGAYNIKSASGWTVFDDTFPDFMLLPPENYYSWQKYSFTTAASQRTYDDVTIAIRNEHWIMYPLNNHTNLVEASTITNNPMIFNLDDC